MEIERKYLVKTLPDHLEQYACKVIEQGYLNTNPVVRIRRSNDDYILTYKGKGMMVREEYNLPLNEEAFLHLKEKNRRKADSETPLSDPACPQIYDRIRCV